MCGIIARIGEEKKPVELLKGVKELEYRGYDSYGVLFTKANKEIIFKDVGTMPETLIQTSYMEIAHTRWATHGKVSKVNAHPHSSKNNKVHVVMNGIIENYKQIKCKFQFQTQSQTDTEILAHLLENNLGNSLYETIQKTIQQFTGNFSFVAKINKALICYKKGNPLIIGVKENDYYISSDLSVIKEICDSYYVMEDYDMAIISKETGMLYYHNNLQIQPLMKLSSNTKTKNSVKNYVWNMEQEIHDQKYISSIITSYNKQTIDSILTTLTTKNIIITASGSSHYAGLYLHYKLLEHNILSQVIIASELTHYINSINNAVVIAISQSGETADVITPLNHLTQSNTILAIVNTLDSTLDRMADNSLYLNCDKEKGVAATKSFVSQIAIAELIKSRLNKTKISFHSFAKQLEHFIEENTNIIKLICQRFENTKSIFFVGREIYYPLALEAALKFKELTYMNAEGFAAGELKHGTLSLIEKNTPVVMLGDDEKLESSITEMKTRGATIIGFENEISDIKLKGENTILNSILFFQLLAFHMALEKGNNPDKPRNLAKSVTVQ